MTANETARAALVLALSLATNDGDETEVARLESEIAALEVETPKRTRKPRAARIARTETAPTLAAPKSDRIPARIVVLRFLREVGSFALASEISKATGEVSIRAAREAAHRLVNEGSLVMISNLAGEEGTITYRFALPGTDRNRFYGDPILETELVATEPMATVTVEAVA